MKSPPDQAKELEALWARVDNATLGPTSPIRTAKNSDDFLRRDELIKFRDKRITELTSASDEDKKLLLKFLGKLKPNPGLDLLRLVDRSVYFNRDDIETTPEDHKKITQLLLNEINEKKTAGEDPTELNFLHYLTRVSMSIADGTCIAPQRSSLSEPQINSTDVFPGKILQPKNENIENIKKEFIALNPNDHGCINFEHFLNFDHTLDSKLAKLLKDDNLSASLKNNLESSSELFFVELREYILNRPDYPLGSDSGSDSHFKDLKEASAIGVLVTHSTQHFRKHSYEAREQAVNFLCSRGEDNKYEIKDEYKQGNDINTLILPYGIECFQEDEDKLFTKSPSFKGFKDFENGIKPILSSIPPLQTALSTLGFLFLGNRETDNTIHGIKFKPSHDPTRTNVKRIIKSSQFGPVL